MLTQIKMKKLFGFIVGAALLASCGNAASDEATTDESMNTETTEEVAYEVFGEEITPDGAIDGTELIAMLDSQDSVEVKLTGTIAEVCQKKGCWMNVDLGNGEEMLVRFKDYGFFVPMDADGKTVTMNGWAKVEEQSVEWLQHQAEDAGKSEEEIAQITEPEVSLSFMASGVAIQ